MNDKIFEDYKPTLIKRFKDNARRTYGSIREDLGPDFKGVYNSWTWVKAFNNAVKPVFNTATKTIDEAKLDAAAQKYADDTVEAWKLKIAAKLGELDTGKVHHISGADFCIIGTKDGHNVIINQQMIINVSGKGTLFNQFPARITLDGKSTSAAKFKKFFA